MQYRYEEHRFVLVPPRLLLYFIDMSIECGFPVKHSSLDMIHARCMMFCMLKDCILTRKIIRTRIIAPRLYILHGKSDEKTKLLDNNILKRLGK